MRVVAIEGKRERELELLCGVDATVADVALAVFGTDRSVDSLYIDGRCVPVATSLGGSGLTAGCRLALAPPPPEHSGTCEVQVLSGAGAGTTLAVPQGIHVIGSGPQASVRYRAEGVRPHHGVLDVGESGSVRVGRTLEAPTAPITPNTLLEVGGSLLSIGPHHGANSRLATMPGRRGTVAFNRPPRRLDHSTTPSIPYPEALQPSNSTSRLSIVSLIVPVLFGIVLAVLIHPRMALFALLGPVMMLGGWLEDRRRKRRFARDAAAQDETDIRLTRTAIELAAAAEVTALHRRHPRVASLAQWPGTSTRLWERRPAHDDFMALVVGYGRLHWRPRMEGNPTRASEAVRRAVAATTRLPRAPVTVDLVGGRVIGVAGDRPGALQAVRGLLCQSAVLHGPADLQIAVVTDHPDDWRWIAWLPHTVADAAAGTRFLAVTPDERASLVALLTPVPAERAGPWAAPAPPPAPAPLTLLVVDTAEIGGGDGAGLRSLLGGSGGPIAGIVVADGVERLPSVCSTVLELAGHSGQVSDGRGSDVSVGVAGADIRVARDLARRLARYDDPERVDEGAELPASIRLVELIGGVVPDPDALADRWAAAGSDPSLAAPIGVTETGPLVLDMLRDGPHGLLAGTTGSGKSELLRTLVASLAMAVDPEHLTFVLIDYKGGSAFDVCAELPHTVGMVTDLDDQLAARALQCLEAELRHREHRLRQAAADDLSDYLAGSPTEPLPRMVIVIDEFAALAKELPDFMAALVDIAARGRSLGVHLLLATQRPAGVIRDNIRANTNLRIALRVQDRSDSTDVIGDPRAGAIGRTQPGRGFVRFGPSEIVPFQTALVTGNGGGDSPLDRVAVRQIDFAMEPAPLDGPEVQTPETNDLEHIVAVAREAARLAGCRPPRRPWPDPLPELVTLDTLEVTDPPTPFAVPIGLVDEPDHQRQRTMWWDPTNGSLAMYGLVGAGTTTAVSTIVTSLAHRFAPDELHCYVMDFDAGALSPLAELPHVGAVVTAAERERQVRLVRHLAGELDRRKQGGASSLAEAPLVVIAVDNFAGFTSGFDSIPDAPIKDAFHRVLLEGPGVRMVCVLTGTRQNAIPLPIVGTIAAKLVFRMADPLAAATFGMRRIPTDLATGRAIHTSSRRSIQVAVPHSGGLAIAVEQLATASPVVGGPRPIDELPLVVKSSQVASTLRILDQDWWVPVGIGDSTLEPVGLPLASGDHALIVGEPRSGRSSLLLAIGDLAAHQRPDVAVTAVALRRSPLRELATAHRIVTDHEDLDAIAAEMEGIGGPHLVLIDDIDSVEGTPGLQALVGSHRADLRVIGAGRRDLKAQYNHWARALCRSRVGVWLAPAPGLDGDLWSTPMPRHIPGGLPAGRGYVVAGGNVELAQMMLP